MARRSAVTSRRAAAIGAVAWIAASLTLGAQSKPPVPPAEFARWETLVSYPRATSTGPLSPDGRWLVHGISRQNRDNELRLIDVASRQVTTIPFGEQPVFSADSQWLAYTIGLSESDEERLQRDRRPVRRKVGIRNLSNGTAVVVDNIESFAFSADGTYLALRGYAPEPGRGGDGGGSADEERDRAGATLLVRALARGVDTTFGNIVDFAWQSRGPLLALVVGVDGRTGNGVQLFRADTGVLQVLDSVAAVYSGLTWRTDADDLVVLRSKSQTGRDGDTQVVLVWRGLEQAPAAPLTLDPTTGALPDGQRIMAARRPQWSRDGSRLFLGVAEWAVKDDEKGSPAPSANDIAGVDVWHWRDVTVMPAQKVRLNADRQRSDLAVWTLSSNRIVRIANNEQETVRVLDEQARALLIDGAPYGMDRSFGRRHANLYLVDLATGARTPLATRIEDQHLDISPDGRYVVSLQDDQWWLYDLNSGTSRNLTKSVATSFVDRQSDATVKQKPPYGVGGWTASSHAVWLYDRFDIWEVPVAGGAPVRLTDGTAEQVRHRVVRLDPDARFIDRSRPVTIALFGERSKRSGYARVAPGAAAVERGVWLDKRVDRLAKAKDADVYAYVAQAFDDSPDYFVAGPGLADGRLVTTTNPFQADYAWGRAELIDFVGGKGDRLQGILHYPAAYDASRKYPMIVYMYERLSDGLHAYVSPTDRAPYNASVFTQHGYFVLQPDIVFRPRDPGLSVVDCVVPAVKAATAKASIDPARVGIIGHSWGGFDTVFLAARTTVFAAAVAGAPITNLVSNYGNHHWNGGIAETDHIETGQQRMEVPLWEDLQAYIRNSAVYGVHTMKTPLLIAFGDNDGTVHWHQGVEMYNIARRAGRPLVMLAYAGEDHGLRRRANQTDYQRRILQWFGHYLKQESAPTWIERGVTAVERDREVKKPVPSTPAPTTTAGGTPR